MSGFDRALVLDDLAPTRVWLARALQQAFPGIAVAEAGSLAEAFAQCERDPPPLALVDLGLPDGSGLRVIERLVPQGTLCVVATVFDDDAHLFPALRAGAQGYVLKDQDGATLSDMLRGIVAGQPPLSPSIARRLLRHFQPVAAPVEPPSSLTPRETEVLRLIAKGLTIADVGEVLGISRHTASGYVKEVYRKLSVGSRAEAALQATRLGLIDDRSA